jgi:hypothetical protein
MGLLSGDSEIFSCGLFQVITHLKKLTKTTTTSDRIAANQYKFKKINSEYKSTVLPTHKCCQCVQGFLKTCFICMGSKW